MRIPRKQGALKAVVSQHVPPPGPHFPAGPPPCPPREFPPLPGPQLLSSRPWSLSSILPSIRVYPAPAAPSLLQEGRRRRELPPQNPFIGQGHLKLKGCEEQRAAGWPHPCPQPGTLLDLLGGQSASLRARAELRARVPFPTMLCFRRTRSGVSILPASLCAPCPAPRSTRKEGHSVGTQAPGNLVSLGPWPGQVRPFLLSGQIPAGLEPPASQSPSPFPS